MKTILILTLFTFFFHSCQKEPELWDGPQITQPRDQLTVEQLLDKKLLPLTDMSFFARPKWAQPAKHQFSGAISFENTEMGPLRFERRSEDPQSPRIVQATLWPRHNRYACILYLTCLLKI